METTVTPEQVKYIHFLFKASGLNSVKDEMVWQYTDATSCKPKDLTPVAGRELINYLKKRVDLPVDPREKMRKKILSMAHEMRWQLPALTPGAKRAIDIDRVNDWCSNYGYLGKKLNAYTYEELPRLVTQFEKVYDGFLKGI